MRPTSIAAQVEPVFQTSYGEPSPYLSIDYLDHGFGLFILINRTNNPILSLRRRDVLRLLATSSLVSHTPLCSSESDIGARQLNNLATSGLNPSLQLVSHRDRHCIHSYIDICPESPDSASIMFFEFDQDVPGNGTVTLASRSDPTRFRSIGRANYGTAHEAAYQQWVSNNEVIFRRDGHRVNGAILTNLSRRSSTILPLSVRSYSPESELGLYCSDDAPYLDEGKREASVSVINISTRLVVQTLSIRELMLFLPYQDRIASTATLGLKHAKWSPDGMHYLFVVHNENHHRARSTFPIKALFVASKDNSRVRYFGEIGDHPMWSPNGEFIYFLGRTTQGRGLICFDVESAKAYQLLARCRGNHAVISPQGKEVVTDIVEATPTPLVHISIWTLKGSEQRILSLAWPKYSDRSRLHAHATWGRDDSRIYLNSAHAGHRGLYVYRRT